MVSAAIFQPNANAGGLAFSQFVANTRRLLPFVLLSALLHVIWVWVLPPMTSASLAMTKQLITIVKIAPRQFETTEILSPTQARTNPKQAMREVNAGEAKSSSISVDATPTIQTTTPGDFVVPHIDVGVLVRSAAALARETPAAKPHTQTLDLTVSPMASAIAGAARNDVWVESRTSEGVVMKNGKTTCIIAPQFVPHYMQGMLIVPQCSVGK